MQGLAIRHSKKAWLFYSKSCQVKLVLFKFPCGYCVQPYLYIIRKGGDHDLLKEIWNLQICHINTNLQIDINFTTDNQYFNILVSQ